MNKNTNSTSNLYMGLFTGKPDFVACDQQSCRQACAFMQSDQCLCYASIGKFNTVKPVLRGHSKRRPKIGFKDQLLFNAGQKYCRMLQESILQYFRPSLSYHLSLRSLIPLFLSGRLRQILLYLTFLYGS